MGRDFTCDTTYNGTAEHINLSYYSMHLNIMGRIRKENAALTYAFVGVFPEFIIYCSLGPEPFAKVHFMAHEQVV